MSCIMYGNVNQGTETVEFRPFMTCYITGMFRYTIEIMKC